MKARRLAAAFLAAGALLAGSAAAQRPVDDRVFRILQGPVAAGERLVTEPITLDDGTEVTLEVSPLKVFADDAEIVVHGPSGEWLAPAPSDRWFTGTVVGDPESLVVLALGSSVRGFAVMKDRVVTFSPEGGAYRDGPPGRTLVRMISPETDVPDAMRHFRCDADMLPVPQEPPALTFPVVPLTSVMYYAGIAVETDYELYAKFNSVPNLTQYVGDLFAAASAVYQRDVLVTQQVNYLSIWTTPADPWAASGSTSAALNEFLSYWNTNRTAVPRSTAHMLSGKNLGGGVAYLSALCSSYGYGFSSSLSGVSPPNITTTYWDFLVVTHEIGHNFSSPHTHCYSPPVDQCWNQEGGCYSGPVSVPPEKGTIMSYCHQRPGGYSNIKMFLGVPAESSNAVLTRIRSYVESHTSCFGTVPGPKVTGISPPTGGGAGGTPVTISGSGFAGGATVKVGGLAATSVVVVNVSTITATTPAHAAGTADVTVTNPGNQGYTLVGGYTYTCPYPTPTASNTGPYCTGATISLSTPTVSGATYAWTGPNGFTSSTQNPTIPNAATANVGTYSVTVTAASCVSAPANTTVTVNPMPATPTASNTGPYCSGATISLSTPTVSGATYAWTGPAGFTSSTRTPTIPSAITSNTGTYNVTVTVTGCTSAAGTTTVTVNLTPSPYITAPLSALPGTAGLIASVLFHAGNSYAWGITNGTITAGTGTNQITFTAGSSGVTALTVVETTIATSCASPTATANVYINIEPAGLVEDAHASGGTSSNVNNILEPGETVLVNPSWKNIGASPLALTGTASAFTGPAGAMYSLLDSAAGYGTIAPGATTDSFSAGGPSYRLSVSNPATRPATHWDATFLETLSNGIAKSWTLHVGQSFTDVPTSNVAYPFVENIFHNGITAGCGSGIYCPSVDSPRWQMAIFLARSILGSGVPIPTSGTVSGVGPYDCASGGISLFTDVAPTNMACPAIHYIYSEGVTTGCSAGHFCPNTLLPRWQMAIFLARGMLGPGVPIPTSGTVPSVGSYNCTALGNSLFTDVPKTDVACPAIHYIYSQGVTTGCSAGHFCPNDLLPRWQMAIFLVRAFQMPLLH